MRIRKSTQAMPIRILFLAVCVLISCASRAQTTFSDFIIFGDSVSDAGNINFGLPDLPDPPYFMNRISNGRVAVDYVSESIGFSALVVASERGGNNYAVAGGGIAGSGREDLTAQMDDYLSDVAGSADPTALYFILLGGNDIRGLRSETDSSMAETLIDEIIATYIQQLTRLSAAGARRFFIPNIGDIGRIPETLKREPGEPGIVSRTSSYSKYFNSKLAQALVGFGAQAGVEVVQYDLFSEFESIINSADALGFTFTTVGCLDTSDFFSIIFSVECLFGTRFDEFVFFDNIHPTRKTNSIIGPKMVALISESFKSSEPPGANGAKFMPAILQLLMDD